NGPPALWLLLDADGSRLASDENWVSSLWGAEELPARSATIPSTIEHGNKLESGERPWPSMVSHWRWFAACGGMVPALGWLGLRMRRTRAWLHSAAVAPMLPALVWAALYWHNNGLVPGRMGFDAYDHLRYIEYVRNHWSIPFGNQGWQMYQPPLYYF